MLNQINNLLLLLIFLITIIIIDNYETTPITITKILAGKKKFKTYSLGISFIPTLVKVKPNKLHLTIRKNQYIRPKKFKMDGSLPLKVPTILMSKYSSTPPKDMVINADLSLGPDKYTNNYKDTKYSSSDIHQHQPLPPIEIPLPLPEALQQQYKQHPPPPQQQQQEFINPSLIYHRPLHKTPSSSSNLNPTSLPITPSPQYDDNINDNIDILGKPKLPPPIAPNEQRLLLQQHATDVELSPTNQDQSELLFAPPPPEQPTPPAFAPSSPSSANFPSEMPFLPLPKEYKYQGSNKKRRIMIHDDDDDNDEQIRRRSDDKNESILPPPLLPPPPIPIPPPLPLPLIPPMFLPPPPPPPSSLLSSAIIKRIPWGPPSPLSTTTSRRMMMFDDQNNHKNSISRQMAFELTDLTTLPQSSNDGSSMTNNNNNNNNQQQQFIPTTNNQHQPMKINIGEHYDPNMIYIDEQTVPSESQIDEVINEPVEDVDIDSENPDDGTLGPDPINNNDNVDNNNNNNNNDYDYDGDQQMSESSIQYVKKYGNKKYRQKYNLYSRKYNNKNKNAGPDDFRIDFNLSGPIGGPMVPYGYGDDQDQLNKQLDHIQQSIPVGPYSKSIYNYYLRHTFTEYIPKKKLPYSFIRLQKLQNKYH